MESSKIFLIFLITMAIILTSLATKTTDTLVLDPDVEEDTSSNVNDPSNEPSSFLRRTGRFLADNPRGVRTCDKYPRVCNSKGSPGPDCCRKQCVNVMTDKGNCGKCGKKCKYSEMCCQGKCVNPSKDEKNCGGCKNRCKKGSKCLYGMCSYA